MRWRTKAVTYARSRSFSAIRLSAVGLGHLTILGPIAYWGVTFWDWSVRASDQEVFVTSDKTFHKQKPALIALGANRIEYPENAASLLLGSAPQSPLAPAVQPQKLDRLYLYLRVALGDDLRPRIARALLQVAQIAAVDAHCLCATRRFV